MKKFFAIVSILFLFSCNNNDDNDSVQEQKCYITKFNKANIINGQQFYTSEYVYDGNLIIKKLDYNIVDNTPSGQTSPTYTLQLKSTTEIQYNVVKQPIKIIEGVDYNNIQTIDYLQYDSQGRLSEKNRVSTYLVDNTSSTKNFKYTYDSSNRITLIAEKTTDSWGDVYGENTKTLSYDANGNLKEIEQINAGNSAFKMVTKYDNYDTYKNPYANVNVPFEDIFFLRLSKNNYRKYSKTTYMNGSPTTPYETYEISGYEYNENGYPKFAEYRCQ